MFNVSVVIAHTAHNAFAFSACVCPHHFDQVKRFREAETQHGRVAMLAAVGVLVGENFHPLFGLDGKEILAIDSLTEVRLVFPAFFEILTLVIGALEVNRAIAGWTRFLFDS